jgi:hypothetical protein
MCVHTVNDRFVCATFAVVRVLEWHAADNVYVRASTRMSFIFDVFSLVLSITCDTFLSMNENIEQKKTNKQTRTRTRSRLGFVQQLLKFQCSQ